MRHVSTGMLILVALTICGCKSTGLLAKREAEKCCPTDIRKTVPWCAGEDAIFHCPCEPSTAFYGYKPTCWRTWPSSGSAWRDIHCGETHHRAVIKDLTHQNSELIQLPPLQALPEPTPAEPAPEGISPESAEPSSTLEKKFDRQLTTDEVPRLKSAPRAEADSEKAESPELKPLELPQSLPEVEDESSEALDEDLPQPIFGPIPLPPVDEE